MDTSCKIILYHHGKPYTLHCKNLEDAYQIAKLTASTQWRIIRSVDNVRIAERFGKGHSGVEMMRLTHILLTKSLR